MDELFSAADAYIRNPDLEGVEAYLSAEALLDDLKKFSIGLLNAFRKVSAKSGEVPAGFMNFRHDLQHHPLEKREVKEPEAAPPVYLPHRRNRLLRHYEDWIKKIGETLGQAGQATVEQKAVDRAAGGLDAAVTGQGGIGKTAMANEYAWTHQADYPGGVFWLQMDLGPAQALTEAANRLGWAIPDNLNDQQVRDLVLRKIGESRGLKLIVLDNLEEPAVPAELNLPDAHLLVTTRRTDVDLPPVKMDLPPEDDALDIFLGSADLDPTDLGEAETPAARAICERVGFLPLALEILGKVARKTALADLTDDLGDVLEHQATVHGKKGEILSIGAALALAESQYGHARAVEALTYLGYFHPEHIDPGLLGLVMEVEEEEAREILEALAEFSVIQPRHEAGGYVAHRLVQEAARGLDPQKQAGTRVVSVLDAIIRAVSEKGAYQTAYPLIPHLLHIAGFSREFTDEDAFPNVLVLVRWAEYLKNSGVYSSSEAVSQTCLARMGKAKGEDHPDYAINLNNLAGVLRSQGRYEEAEALYRRALAIDEQTIGPDHPDYATHLNNLALVLQAQGKYEEAEALYRRALAIDEQTIGPDHP
ncbi:MAG: tetratricopeptide repeat protein, partial [Proteobacteria bacterium]|nr:tetratricopeptide repeat protein [Pseudomonadota bacterium]